MARRHIFQANPNMWSAGAVVLPQQQHAQYANQMAMHQMAKEQSLNQYYDKLQNSINPAGVRDVDLDGWNKKADDWQRFGIENRAALINPRLDRGRSLTQFESMHRDLLGDIQKSKQEAAKELTLGKIYSDPRKAQLATRQDLQLAHSMSASIYDQAHYKEDGVTPHSLDEFSFNAPPYDLNKQKVVSQLLNRGLKKDRTFGKGGPVDSETRLTIVPYTEKHSDSNLKTIAERMADMYKGDKSIQQFYDNDITDPDTYAKRNAAYQSIYGKNQDIGNDPMKHAMADAIIQNSQVDTGNVPRSVSRPPVGRALTKAQQDQQLMMDWTNQMAGALKSRNVGEAKRLGSTLFSGNGKSAYQDIDQGPLTQGMANLHPKQGFNISYVNKEWVPDDAANPSGTGQMKDVLHKDELDPDDPALTSKLGRYFQMTMGSTPSLEKGIVKQTLGQPSTSPPPVSAPPSAPLTPSKDPLNLFK